MGIRVSIRTVYNWYMYQQLDMIISQDQSFNIYVTTCVHAPAVSYRHLYHLGWEFHYCNTVTIIYCKYWVMVEALNLTLTLSGASVDSSVVTPPTSTAPAAWKWQSSQLTHYFLTDHLYMSLVISFMNHHKY